MSRAPAKAVTGSGSPQGCDCAPGLVKDWKCGERGPWSSPNKKGGGYREKGLQGQKGCFGPSECRQRTRVIALASQMHVCVPMPHTLCFIGSTGPVVCPASPSPAPPRDINNLVNAGMR